MDYHIALIIPNKIIADSAKKIMKRLGFNYPVYHASREKALKIAQFLHSRGCKIIISVGVTAQYIQKNTSMLILELQYSGLDFVAAIEKAQKTSDKIAIIGADNLTYAARRTIESLNIHVPVFELCIDEPIEQQAERVINLGYEVIISGSPSVFTALRMGKQGIMPDMDDKQIEYTILHAQQILNLLNEAEQKFEIINTLLNCTSESIIGTDLEGKIIFCNATFQRLLGLQQNEIIQHSMNELLEQKKLFNILGKNNNDKINYNEYHGIVINSLPIVVEEQVIGFVHTIHEISEILQIESRIRKELLNKGHFAKHTFRDIIGKSDAIQKTISIARKYASINSTVLILGETGTGKELFAQSIHNESSRHKEAFIAINCSSIPENLLESELFGYEKGAFTGAKQDGKAGLFEMAHQGTIFLDEISELPLQMQGHLLRVLQEKEVRRIGGERVIPIDVRVIAASNKSLKEMVEQNRFRADLYYRLNIMELHLPPLRERIDDIGLLCNHLVSRKCQEFGKAIQYIAPEFIDALKHMEWEGNIRQLSNTIERLILLSENNMLDVGLLRNMGYWPAQDVTKYEHSDLRNYEYKHILAVLEKNNGNKQAAAKALGIAPSTLWRKLKQYEQ